MRDFPPGDCGCAFDFSGVRVNVTTHCEQGAALRTASLDAVTRNDTLTMRRRASDAYERHVEQAVRTSIERAASGVQ